MRLCGRRACEFRRQVSVCVYQSRLDMAASNTKPQGLPLKQNSVHTAPYPAPPLVLEAGVDGCCDSSPLPGSQGLFHSPPAPNTKLPQASLPRQERRGPGTGHLCSPLPSQHAHWSPSTAEPTQPSLGDRQCGREWAQRRRICGGAEHGAGGELGDHQTGS